MAQQHPEHRMDERLAALLDVERQLETRAQQREHAARAKVEAARAALQSATEGVDAELERLAELEARADEAAHGAALAALSTAHRATLATFAGVSDERIEQLARDALARAVGSRGPR
jgi:hypothetical protein